MQVHKFPGIFSVIVINIILLKSFCTIAKLCAMIQTKISSVMDLDDVTVKVC